jgi:hypothetical protein
MWEDTTKSCHLTLTNIRWLKWTVYTTLSLSCMQRMVQHISVIVGIDSYVLFYVIVWGTLHVKRYTKKLSLFWAKFCLWRNCFIVTRACRSQTCFNQDPVACSQMISWKWQREEESKGKSSMIDKWEDLACFLEEVLESWNTPPWRQGHTEANIL